MRKQIDLTGQRHNDVVVLEFSHKDKQGRSYWKCINEHGKITNVRSDNLKRTRQQQRDCGRLRAIWRNMHDRCENINNRKYRIYGAVGKAVCEEWRNYDVFKEWALSNGYNDTLTIERIDGTKGYSPENCRWATSKEQANNTSRNHIIEYNGETHTMAEWAEITGIPYQTLAKRINRLHWNVCDALMIATHKYQKRK